MLPSENDDNNVISFTKRLKIDI